ncbi:hypothetical protein ACXPVS_03085 [Pseudomonas sp. Ma2-10]
MNIVKKVLLPSASILLLLVSVQGFADDECARAFMNSSAAATCSGKEVTTQSPQGTCNLNQECMGTGAFTDGSAGWRRVSADKARNIISVPLSDVGKLSNCNSKLTVGGC